MNLVVLFFTGIFFSALPAVAPSNHPIFIIWNVGQGQWLTGVQWDRCDHFDFGGEKYPLRPLQRICGKKENSLNLSHWDFDHWNGLPKFQQITSQVCHSPWPIPAPPKTLPWLARKIPICSQIEKPWFVPIRARAIINGPSYRAVDFVADRDGRTKCLPAAQTQGQPTKSCHKRTSENGPFVIARTLSLGSREGKGSPSNDSSQVYVFQDQILIPGDSTQKMEQIWAGNDLGIVKKNIRILILGHHGSKTSSSETLLDHLPHLKLAVASARKSRYGHPHTEVVSRLKKHRIPLLRTEDWGHIGIEI